MSRSPPGAPSIWFERLCGRLGVSFRIGVVFVATIPIVVASFFSSYLLGSYSGPPTEQAIALLSFIAFVPVPAVCLYGARYVARSTRELGVYAESRKTTLDVDRLLDGLGSLRYPILVSTPIALVAIPTILAGGLWPPSSSHVLPVLLFFFSAVYVILAIGTLIWVFGYSMGAIHRLGQSPMERSPFGEDRSQGLHPFGKAAFRLTLVYLGAIAVLGVHLNIPPLPALYQLFLLSLFVLAIPLFLVPLWTVHRQIVMAKSRELDWIGKRYAALFAAIKAEGNPAPAPVPPGDVATLSALRQLRDDVERAPTWPFNPEIMAQLLAIVLSISVVLLTSVIRDYLKI